ncbi:hypothetical protein E4T47_01583 [Aureobasidium subglaciale]|nr:hypothetical protein E4T47_01583 [Aureobasidium subglaciale]
MAEANPQAVAELTGISGCTDDVARRWLKIKNNDADAAMNAIFDGEDLDKAESTVTWSETDFSAGRDGTTAFGPQNYSYNEQNLRPLGHSAAPTRGNSPAPSLRQPSNKDDEDADMQRAIAASQQGSTGVTLPNANFQPAMGDHYDPSKWSMTTVNVDSQQASEIIPDLEPHERKNEPGEPRFLKQLPSGDYLPNLLTIAHSIPMARKALLAPQKTYSSYGTDPEWWKGHGISLPKIVSTVSGAPLEPATTNQDEILAEMQRLMALLDESERSYGSADTLVRLAGADSGCILDRVLKTWEKASLDSMEEYYDDDKFFVFHSIVDTTNPQGMATTDLFSLPLFVKSGPDAPSTELASIMDDALWDTGDEAASYDNYIDHCAQVLPIRLTQNNTSKDTLNVIIPPILYVDKYLKENADATREVRKQMAQSKKKIDKIEMVQSRLRNYRHAQKGNLSSSQLMKHARGYFSGATRRNMIEEREGAGAVGDTDIPPPLEHHGVIAEQLEAVCKEVDAKLEALEQEREKARKALAQLSQETGLAQENLKHRYTLRGVSTKSHVTYLLQPRDPLDGSIVDDEDAPEGMQWWRIEYDVHTNGAKVIKTKSAQDDVIRAVELEHNQALLVYASDYAISDEHDVELTTALEEFIHHDDESFEAELQMNGFGHGNVYPAYEGVPRRRGSGDSTAANFGNDDAPPSYEPPPYDAGIEYGRIPTDMQDSKDAVMNGTHSPPAHEIRLEQEDIQHTEENKGGVEMIEKALEEPSLYRFGSDGSKMTKQVGDDAMTGIKIQDEEAELIDFRD